MDQWVAQFVSQIGLPGAICFYVLFQLKKSVDANTQAITLLAAKFNVTVPEQITLPQPKTLPYVNPFKEADKP